MAGSQNIGEASDNPVAINVTAMVDVIFCLCLFFMCSLHFKQLEGKVDTWLPKEKGPNHGTVSNPQFEEIRVFMRWDHDAGRTVRKIGNRPPVSGDEELVATMRDMRETYVKAGKSEVPVLLDATDDVPWQDVIHVLDLCNHDKFEKVEFVAPMEYRAK